MLSSSPLYLLLGANLGDRTETFKAARTLLERSVGTISRSSSLYETAPWGVLDQPSFLNQVLEIDTKLAPEGVLSEILAIEKHLGRVRHHRWEARLIDIDILYYGGLSIQTEDLTVPHPRLHERRFTLAPLSEIAPAFLHPVLQQTNEELLRRCPDESKVAQFS